MAKRFLKGMLMTLGFAVGVLVSLFCIFTLVSYLAGPVGG